jgi:hypothetical protein
VLPATQNLNWVAQRFERPQIIGHRVVITSPGVCSIECLDLDSGELLWRQVLADVNRLVSASRERIIVHAGEKLVAFDFASGKLQWERRWPKSFDAELTSGAGGLLLTRRAASPAGNQFGPELVWLDPQTGAEKAHTTLSSLFEADPRFGPLFSHGGRVWAFSGKGIEDQHRELIELVAQGEASQPFDAEGDSDSDDAIWLSAAAPPEVMQGFTRVLPDWTLLATVAESSTFLADTHGEKDMMRLTSKLDAPTVVGRWVDLPQQSKWKVKMRIGSEPNHHWKLIVRLGDQVLHEQTEEWAKNPQVWKDITVDLSRAAGKKGWLTVEAQFVAGGDRTWTYWKRLDVAQ